MQLHFIDTRTLLAPGRPSLSKADMAPPSVPAPLKPVAALTTESRDLQPPGTPSPAFGPSVTEGGQAIDGDDGGEGWRVPLVPGEEPRGPDKGSAGWIDERAKGIQKQEEAEEAPAWGVAEQSPSPPSVGRASVIAPASTPGHAPALATASAPSVRLRPSAASVSPPAAVTPALRGTAE